jgi:hypothetical protein
VVEHPFGEARAHPADMLQDAAVVRNREDERADPVGKRRPYRAASRR